MAPIGRVSFVNVSAGDQIRVRTSQGIFAYKPDSAYWTNTAESIGFVSSISDSVSYHRWIHHFVLDPQLRAIYHHDLSPTIEEKQYAPLFGQSISKSYPLHHGYQAYYQHSILPGGKVWRYHNPDTAWSFSSDFGRRWQSLPLTKGLLKITMKTAQIGFAITEEGHLFITENNWIDYQELPSPFSEEVRSVVDDNTSLYYWQNARVIFSNGRVYYSPIHD